MATLGLVLILVVAMSLGALGVARALAVEHRGLALQVQGALAHEAAQFGLDRAWTLLDEPRAVGSSCEAGAASSAASGATNTLDRLSTLDAARADAAPRLVLACSRVAEAWRCWCPDPALADPGAGLTALGGDREGLVVEARWLDADDPVGRIELTATACAEGGAPCARLASRGAASREPGTQLTQMLVRRPALAAWPAAAAVASDALHLGAGTRAVNTGHDGHGLAVQAGRSADLAGATLEGLPGSPRSALVASPDERLAAGDAGERLQRWLGLAPDRWHGLARVGRLDCAARRCTEADLHAMLGQGLQQIAVRGDLHWSAGAGSATWGHPDAPLLLVVNGDLLIEGPGRIDAVVLAHTARLVNPDAARPLELHGAIVAAEDLSAHGAVVLRHAGELVPAVARRTAALVRLNGSWRELPAP
jgi:hypothetical protein